MPKPWKIVRVLMPKADELAREKAAAALLLVFQREMRRGMM